MGTRRNNQAEAMDKQFISPARLYRLSFALGQKILKSGYRPDFIIALWRGGAPIGAVIQEYLAYHDLPTDHIAIRTSAYPGAGTQPRSVRIHGMGYLRESVKRNHRILVVDDVFDTGKTLSRVVQTLNNLRQKPAEVRLATLYFKPEKNRTTLRPHFYLHTTGKWLVFPHELMGLEKEELKRKGKALQPYLQDPE